TPVAELEPVFLAARQSNARRCTTPTRSRARTCASATPCSWRKRARSFPRSSRCWWRSARRAACRMRFRENARSATRRSCAAKAKDLARTFRSLDKLTEATDADLLRIEGFGEKTATAVRTWLADAANRALISDLLSAGVTPTAPAAASSSLAGKTFVFTGTL